MYCTSILEIYLFTFSASFCLPTTMSHPLFSEFSCRPLHLSSFCRHLPSAYYQYHCHPSPQPPPPKKQKVAMWMLDSYIMIDRRRGEQKESPSTISQQNRLLKTPALCHTCPIKQRQKSSGMRKHK